MQTTTKRPSVPLEQISLALNGANGPDQQRIAVAGLTLLGTLLAKNADYGESAWKPPILAPDVDVDTALRVRMSDKIERIISLSGKPPEVVSESLADTFLDLAGYAILWSARPKGGE